MPQCPAKNTAKVVTSQRGRCTKCNRVFKRLDTHLCTSATCKLAGSLAVSNTAQLSTPDIAARQLMNTEEHPPQPHPAASVLRANEPNIHLAPPFRMPQTDQEWEADNTSLGSLVHQVTVAQSVNDKNSVLCDGLYHYFTARYGLKVHRNSQPKGGLELRQRSPNATCLCTGCGAEARPCQVTDRTGSAAPPG